MFVLHVHKCSALKALCLLLYYAGTGTRGNKYADYCLIYFFPIHENINDRNIVKL